MWTSQVQRVRNEMNENIRFAAIVCYLFGIARQVFQARVAILEKCTCSTAGKEFAQYCAFNLIHQDQ
jgi:hypothetical protein